MAGNLGKFFEPKSVVVIGASSAPHKPGNDVVRNILANGYAGKLYLVNPKGGEIMGMKVESSVHDLPEGIELAVVTLPAGANPHHPLQTTRYNPQMDAWYRIGAALIRPGTAAKE